MLSMEFIKSEERTYQQEIKDLEQQVNFYRNKSQRLEKENKKLKDNWNELKKWLEELQKFKGINQQGFSWGVAQEVLDKMQELEQGKEWKD